MNRTKVAFIGTPDLPIPSFKGGAIQTLVTALINENEKKSLFDFTVFTVETQDIEKYISEYRYTKFIPIKINNYSRLKLFCRRALRRLSSNYLEYKSDYMQKINQLLGKEKYDFVIFETTDKEVVQLDLNKVQSAKVLYHVHSEYLNDNIDRIDVINKKVDYYVTVSDYIKNAMQTNTSLCKSRYAVLKNAVDIKSYLDLDISGQRSSTRRKYGFSEYEKVIVYCSRLSREKGCLELIKAVNKIKNCRLLIIGGENFSSNKKTKYVKELKNEADKSTGRIVFTGFIPHEDIWKIIAGADIGVVPSICNEAASLTLVEFRALGIPTIASNVGGIPEYCNDKSTRLVTFDNKFVDNLVNALQELCDNEQLREKMAVKAREDLDIYTYSSYFDRFSDLINSLS